MKPQSLLRVAIALLIPIAVGAYLAWDHGLFQKTEMSAPANALLVIEPYRYAGTWVFDDSRVGLVREPFVSGVPEMIDQLTSHITTATNGFRMLFSASPFPDYQKKLIRTREHMGGNYYRFEGTDKEGWICPALFRYYQKAPEALFVKAEAKN